MPLLRILAPISICLIAAAVSGCTAKLNDATTSESLTAARKAGVVLRMGLASEDCNYSTITLARRSGDIFVHAANLVQLDNQPEPAVVHVELDPGEYHVVSWSCTAGHETKILGTDFFYTYSKSLAHFEVRAGEIVNLGALNIILVGPKTVYLAVSDLPPAMLEGFRQEYPKLAARMQTRLLEVTMPALSPTDRAVYCFGINKFHQKWKLPPHPGCAMAMPPVAEIDPGKPALFYRP